MSADRDCGADDFDSLAPLFAEQLDAVRDCVEPAYVRPDWAERSAQLADDLLPVPPPDFLSHPAIRYQMFVDDRTLEHELPYVRTHVPDIRLLTEDAVGAPPTVQVPDTTIWTSSNTVHQMYHLLRYEEATGRRLSDAGTIVEWGGGFGALIRLIVRMSSGSPTSVIIDTPVFSALQWLYLGSVLGEAQVVVHRQGPVRPVHGCVNVVPIGLVKDMEVDADVFISNWALNESMPAAQHDVVARRWFGAESLLMAMHAGDPLAEVALSHGARPVPLGDFMPGQHYFVR